MMKRIGRQMLFWQMLFACILTELLVPCNVSADAYVLTDENGNVLTDENGNVLYRDDNEGGGGFHATLILAIIAVKNGEPGAVKYLAMLVGIAAIVIYFFFFHKRVYTWLRKHRSGS